MTLKSLSPLRLTRALVAYASRARPRTRVCARDSSIANMRAFSRSVSRHPVFTQHHALMEAS
jgi:hypothetical protein